MAKLPYFHFYAQDFDMDTNTWTNEEVGLYLRLLMSEWINGPLPYDIKKLAQIGRISVKKFKNLFQICSPKFLLMVDEKENKFLQNERLEKTRKNLINLLESRRKAGKKGAEKRWKTDSTANSLAIAQPMAKPMAKPMLDQWHSKSNNSLSSDTNVSSDKQPAVASFKKKKGHYSMKIDAEIVDKIDKICKKITSMKLPYFNPYEFAQKNCSQAHPQALLYVLEQLQKQGTLIKSPWAYANKLLHIESQNFNERETVQAHKILKDVFAKLFSF